MPNAMRDPSGTVTHEVMIHSMLLAADCRRIRRLIHRSFFEPEVVVADLTINPVVHRSLVRICRLFDRPRRLPAWTRLRTTRGGQLSDVCDLHA